jgi:hypothetical protein
MAKLEEKPRKDEYPWRNPEETRIKVLIEPEKVDASGFDE